MSFQALSCKKNAAMPFTHHGSDPTLSKCAKSMAQNAAHGQEGGTMARPGGGGGGGGSSRRPSSTLPDVKRPANAAGKRPSTVDPGANVSMPFPKPRPLSAHPPPLLPDTRQTEKESCSLRAQRSLLGSNPGFGMKRSRLSTPETSLDPTDEGMGPRVGPSSPGDGREGVGRQPQQDERDLCRQCQASRRRLVCPDQHHDGAAGAGKAKAKGSFRAPPSPNVSRAQSSHDAQIGLLCFPLVATGCSLTRLTLLPLKSSSSLTHLA